MYYVEKNLLPFVVTQPAAGADWSYTLPAGAKYELFSLQLTFVTSAVVANRRPTLQFLYGKTLIFSHQSAFVITAGASVSILALSGASHSFNNNVVLFFTLPTPCILRGETIIKTVTSAIDVGDQYSAITFYAHVVPCKEEDY